MFFLPLRHLTSQKKSNNTHSGRHHVRDRYIISSLDRPTSGDVLVDNVSLFSISSKELHRFRNEKMGFVFQFHHLLPELTALENLLRESY